MRRHAVCFEITETAAIANLARVTHFMNEVKRLGCLFSLDDFGSGLSSFAYLKKLPVDFLKVDGGFIQNVADDVLDRSVVQAIHHVGRALGVRVIAEQVRGPCRAVRSPAACESWDSPCEYGRLRYTAAMPTRTIFHVIPHHARFD